MKEENNVASKIDNYQKDFLFFQSKKEEFRKQFPNKFVVISGGAVLFSDGSIEVVKEKLNAQGIEASGAMIEFVPEKETMLVL